MSLAKNLMSNSGGEWTILREEITQTNLNRMWWLLLTSTSLSVALVFFNLLQSQNAAYFPWQVVDLTGSGVFLVLIWLARRHRLPAPWRWRLAPAYFAFWLILMNGYYFSTLRYGETATYAIGVVTPAILILLPPRIFLSLLLPNHAIFCIWVLSPEFAGTRVVEQTLASLVNGTLGVLVASLSAWFLFSARREHFRDIATRQKMQERLVAASQAKSEFLATMSHEIRTPMHIVLGYSNLLRDTPLQPAQREYVDSIANSGQLLLTVINDILDFSKMEAGRLSLHPEPLDLSDLVSQCQHMFEPLARQKNIPLTVSLDPGVPAVVLADRHRIEQVLVNLLSNAVKFTDTGSVTMSVSAEAVDAGKWRLVFRIADTGIGISREQMAQLFQPFSQVDTTMARQYSGTGLGLVIVRKLCELMGGAITAESTRGAGSVFRAAVVVAAAPQDVAPPPAALPDEEPDFSALRVLVVEDNVSNRKLLAALLKRLDIVPTLASGGADALQCVAAATFDVIFMDVQMPGMDGFQTTQMIREWEATRQPPTHTHIIALTALALAEDKVRCLEAGMDDYLSKPIRPDMLVQSLQRVRRAP